MCHALLEDASFWAFIHQLDIDIAAQVQRQGCPHCGGKLHSACYPRKPRGVCRHVLGEAYCWRLSFCCASSDCRRRCTPPSLRFGAEPTLVSPAAKLTKCKSIRAYILLSACPEEHYFRFYGSQRIDFANCFHLLFFDFNALKQLNPAFS